MHESVSTSPGEFPTSHSSSLSFVSTSAVNTDPDAAAIGVASAFVSANADDDAAADADASTAVAKSLGDRR